MSKSVNHTHARTHTHTHTHTCLTALYPGLPGWAGTRKENPIWILLKQETVSGSGIRWAICKSASRSRQITTPAPHHSVFLQDGCPSCCPTNSVKALKACKSVFFKIPYRVYATVRHLSVCLSDLAAACRCIGFAAEISIDAAAALPAMQQLFKNSAANQIISRCQH